MYNGHKWRSNNIKWPCVLWIHTLRKEFQGKDKDKQNLDVCSDVCSDTEIWESMGNFKQSNVTEESGSRAGVAGKGLC